MDSLATNKNIGAVETLKREYAITDTFLEHQQVSNALQRTTDVNLVCSDGVIPAHAAILQAVSPFFDKIFATHGFHNFGFTICQVLLPDYTVAIFKKVVEMIYCGKTNISSDQDSEDIKEILTYFQINISSIEKCEAEPNKESKDLKPILSFSFTSETGAEDYIKAENMSLITGCKIVPETNDDKAEVKALSKKLRPRNSLKRMTVDVESEVDSDSDYDGKSPRKKEPKKGKNGHLASKTKSKRKHVSESSEEEVDPDSIYADMGWFLNESKRCQYCDTQCKTAAAASICLTSHSRLRCYYCFKVVRNTEKLFQHFAEKHKQAGRENCLMCPFCEQTIPYKSVSCHVISMHLQNPANRNKHDGNRRPVTAAGASLQNYINMENQKKMAESTAVTASPSKKRKVSQKDDDSDSEETENEKSSKSKSESGKKSEKGKDRDTENEELKVGDLNLEMRQNSICPGKIRVFIVKKLRIQD